MRNIIRLTESDLHTIVRNTVERIIRESNDEPILAGIADYLKSLENYNHAISWRPGENEVEFDLGDGIDGVVSFYLDTGAYVKKSEYESDPDEIVDDDPEITDVEIQLSDREIPDNGIVRDALQSVLDFHGADYSYGDIPTSDDLEELWPDR